VFKKMGKMAGAALAALVISMPALAIDEGFYVGLGGGVSFTPDIDWSASAPGVTSSGQLELNTGFGVIGAVGYQWKNGLAAEGEIGYRRSTADKISATAAIPSLGIVATASGSAGGSVSALSFMANGRYGLDTGTSFTPFVMGGLGIARVGANNITVSGVALVDDSDWVFAFQGGAGVNVALGDGFSAEASYRFFGTQGSDFKSGGVKIEADGLRNHSIFLVLKYSFGGAK